MYIFYFCSISLPFGIYSIQWLFEWAVLSIQLSPQRLMLLLVMVKKSSNQNEMNELISKRTIIIPNWIVGGGAVFHFFLLSLNDSGMFTISLSLAYRSAKNKLHHHKLANSGIIVQLFIRFMWADYVYIEIQMKKKYQSQKLLSNGHIVIARIWRC